MENKERKETRKEVERLPYEQYRDNGRKSNTRKINKPNSFKKKIYSLIKQATEEDELLGRCLSIMFLVNHISAHEGFLLENIEKESNYFRTYENIQKSTARALLEIITTSSDVDVKINKHDKKDNRMWDVVVSLEYNELTIVNVVKYSKLKDYLARAVLEETTIEEGITILRNGNEKRELGKQQYHTSTLKETFDQLDSEVFSLMEYRTNKRL
jgi:hypothetical protein